MPKVALLVADAVATIWLERPEVHNAFDEEVIGELTKSIEQAHALCPHNSATSLQVTAPVVAGVIWALRNPDRGVIDPEEMDYKQVLDFIRPYLGEVVGAYSEWTPLLDRGWLFEEDLDRDDPWQFKNFRVV